MVKKEKLIKKLKHGKVELEIRDEDWKEELATTKKELAVINEGLMD